MMARRRYARREAYVTKCRYCQAKIAWLPDYSDYRPTDHGPVNAVGVNIDLDGPADVEGFDSAGTILRGARIPDGHTSEVRVARVYLRHQCDRMPASSRAKAERPLRSHADELLERHRRASEYVD